MIYIEERKTHKLPGETSLFVSFQYNKYIVDLLKTVYCFNYVKSNNEWEIPLNCLQFVIDNLCEIDDITIKIKKDEPEFKYEDIVLSKYKTKPFEYQIEAIKYGLQKNHQKWLLLDQPGLGKTLTALYLAQEIKKRDKIEHCLIICGVNTLKTNWKKEIEKHTNLSCTILGERINSKGNYVIGSIPERVNQLQHKIKEFFVITNVETLRDEKIIKELTNDKHNKFDMIIADEVHCFKSPDAQQTKNFLKLKNAKYKLAMTGTILTNNPLDCYVPLKWIDADRSTYTNCKYFYCNYGGPFNNQLIGYKNISLLKSQLEKYSLRRTKDILDLPPKTIINEFVDMNDAQTKFYNNIKQGVIDEVDKVELTPQSLLGMTIRLRQASECPSILTSENIPSSKILRACDLAREITENNNKLVIFSVFKQPLNELMNMLSDLHPLLCTGDVDDATISKNIEMFQKDEIHKVILCTTAKMGTGITLTRANYSIFLSTPYTDALYQQCQDRIYRIGTKNSVFIYNLIAKDTFDERVLEIVQDKAMLGEYIVDNKVSPKLLSRLKEFIEDL